jgi:hypothetical protein
LIWSITAKIGEAMKSIIINMLVLISIAGDVHAQETETLFGDESQINFVWSPLELSVTGIKGNISTAIGPYFGILWNKSLLIAGQLGANVGHPTVNYGFLGLLVQKVFEPQQLYHLSAQVLLASASTKDYEYPKSNAFDNFGNVSGTGFFFVEPGVNGEVNLSSSFRLVAGLAYRLAFGLDENSTHVALTKVTNQDFSGIVFRLNLKIGDH